MRAAAFPSDLAFAAALGKVIFRRFDLHFAPLRLSPPQVFAQLGRQALFARHFAVLIFTHMKRLAAKWAFIQAGHQA